MIDKKKLERRFSRNAKTYDEYAVVQKEMSRKLISIVKTESPKRILEIGCGTGYLTELVADRFPEADILALDLAPGMIEVASKRLEDKNKAGRITFLCADAESDFPEGKYDLIISNATFQWFNHPDEMALKIMNSLTEDGQCLFSTFGSQTFIELGQAFRMAAMEMELEEEVRASQNFLTAYDWVMRLETAKAQAGVRAAVTSYENMLPEYFTDCMAFFQSVKKIGANNANSSRSTTSPKFMQTVTDIYEREFMTDKGISATYHALYLSIEKIVDEV